MQFKPIISSFIPSGRGEQLLYFSLLQPFTYLKAVIMCPCSLLFSTQSIIISVFLWRSWFLHLRSLLLLWRGYCDSKLEFLLFLHLSALEHSLCYGCLCSDRYPLQSVVIYKVPYIPEPMFYQKVQLLALINNLPL